MWTGHEKRIRRIPAFDVHACSTIPNRPKLKCEMPPVEDHGIYIHYRECI